MEKEKPSRMYYLEGVSDLGTFLLPAIDLGLPQFPCLYSEDAAVHVAQFLGGSKT